MPPVQLPPTPRIQPLVPAHRIALAHLMTIRRQPAVHPVTIRAVQLGIRPPFVQPQKSLRAAVANLKIGPPTAIRLRHHRRPDPRPDAEPARKSTSHQKQSPPPAERRPHRQYAFPPPAHPVPCGGPPLFTPLADRRHADPENSGEGTQRTALLIHRPSAFLVGRAGAMVGSIGDNATARSRRSDRPGGLWRRRLWASSWIRIRGSRHRGDRRYGGSCGYLPEGDNPIITHMPAYIENTPHLMENCFGQMKGWRGVAMRYAKKAAYLAICRILLLALWAKVI